VERVVDRAVKAGYRSDWRGMFAYMFTPEAWTTPTYTAFVMAVGGFVFTVMLQAATGRYPLVNVPFMAVMGYGLVVRPVLRIAERRAAPHSSPISN